MLTPALLEVAPNLPSETIAVLLFIGCLGGFLAGLLGVGGGVIFIPVIATVLAKYQLDANEVVKFTLANSIALVFLSGLSGTFQLKKMGKWDWKQSLFIGIPGAIVSLLISQSIQRGNWYHKDQFQWVFLSFLILSIVNMLFSKVDKNSTAPNSESVKSNPLLAISVGIFAGCVVALSGMGGGIIMVPMFRMILKKPMHQATSLSLSIVPILSITSLFQYLTSLPHSNLPMYHTGYLIWPMLIPMMLGVVFLSSFGQKTAPRISVLWLRIIFAVLSSVILIKTLFEIFSN